MHIRKQDILNMDRIKRLNMINSVTGIKPANLIGTISDDGQLNLAIFSSVVHMGSNPALLGFFVRPTTDVPRHTYENIKSRGTYTINHVHHNFAENAHFTSAKFDRDNSEFEECGLTEEYIDGFDAPFVKESQLKIGMRFEQEIHIPLNGTILMIGSIESLTLPNEALHEEGHIDLGILDSVGISGLNSYYSLKKEKHFPYARTSQLPNFAK